MAIPVTTLTLLLEQPNAHQRKIQRFVKETEFVNNNRSKFDQLTNRELQIIELLMQGMNNPEIASALFISRRTVEQHRKNINKKLSIKSYADLFRFGYCFDLV